MKHAVYKPQGRSECLTRTIVTSKENRHCVKSQQAAGQASETGQNLSERCIYALLLLREKRVVLSPMLERKAVCGKQQPTEGCRLRLVSKKAVVTDFSCAGTFWFFSVMKRTYRKT